MVSAGRNGEFIKELFLLDEKTAYIGNRLLYNLKNGFYSKCPFDTNAILFYIMQVTTSSSSSSNAVLRRKSKAFEAIGWGRDFRSNKFGHIKFLISQQKELWP